jgi:hypothetical protein
MAYSFFTQTWGQRVSSVLGGECKMAQSTNQKTQVKKI